MQETQLGRKQVEFTEVFVMVIFDWLDEEDVLEDVSLN